MAHLWKTLKRKIRDTTLYHKLIAGIMIGVIIPSALSTLTFTIKFQDIMETEVGHSYQQIVSQYAENVNYKLGIYLNLAQNIMSNRLVQDTFALDQEADSYNVYELSMRISKELKSLLFNDVAEGIKSVVLYSLNADFPTDGKHISTIERMKSMPWYEDAVGQAGGGIFHTYSKWTDSHVITLIQPILNLSGQPLQQILGYVQIDVDTDHIFSSDLFNSSTSFDTGYIVDKNSEVLFCRNLNPVEEDGSLTEIRSLNEEDASLKVINRNGSNEILISSKLNDYGWTGFFYFPYSEIEQKVVDVRQYVLMIQTVLLAAVIIIAISFLKKFSARISLLMRKMQQVEKGDLETNFVIEGNDEIGMLDKHFNKMVQKLKQSINEIYISQLEKRNAELSALQSQINPHFLYNTLEAINSMASCSGLKDICTICQKLGEMFRYSINNGKNEFVNLQDEIHHIQNYMVIQKIRFDDRFDVFYDFPNEILEYKILKFILQPIVENALNHGFSEKRGKGFLEISGQIKNKKLFLKVQDDGVGMSEEKLRELIESMNGKYSAGADGRGHIGIRNVNSRIKLAYGEEYGITIQSELHAGTQVTVILPAYGYQGGERDV